jgi:hypothetical protein
MLSSFQNVDHFDFFIYGLCYAGNISRCIAKSMYLEKSKQHTKWSFNRSVTVAAHYPTDPVNAHGSKSVLRGDGSSVSITPYLGASSVSISRCFISQQFYIWRIRACFLFSSYKHEFLSAETESPAWEKIF